MELKELLSKVSGYTENVSQDGTGIYEVDLSMLKEEDGKLKDSLIQVHPMCGYNHTFDTGVLFFTFEMEEGKIKMGLTFDSIYGDFPSSMDLEDFDFEGEDYTEYKHTYDKGEETFFYYDPNDEEQLKEMAAELDIWFAYEG